MLVLGHERWSELAFLAVSLAFIGVVAGAVLWVAARREARTGLV
jgi:hypothetical protein